MQKRGQVTAFVVIGIVILLVVFGVIAVKQGYVDLALKKLGIVRVAPVEIRPLEDFLEGCVKQISQEGINLMALQGGYINLPQDPMPNSQFTPVEEVLEIIPGSDLRTALWFRERGNGVQVLEMPSREKIEKELGDYVNNNFDLCLNNLTSFYEQGYDLQGAGTPDTDVIISKKKVRTTVEFPIAATKQEKEFFLSKHTAEIDSNLGELHDLATQIMESQYEDAFLEQQTINMLVVYDQEVPFSGIDLGCTEKIWSKSESILKLQNIIHENMGAISIKGTSRDNAPEYLEFEPLKGTHSNIDISFMYIPSWPTLVEITPSEGDILRGNSMFKQTGNAGAALVAAFACIGDHRFIYDIKYPVLVTLRDENNLIFQFGTEVIIDNNQPRVNTLALPVTAEIENPICKFPQKELTIFTGTYNEIGEPIPLSEVDLSFKCSPASCDLGVSSSDVNPVLTTKVPLCFNGIVEGRKQGYFAGKTLYSSNEETNNQVSVLLEPKYKKRVDVKVIEKSTGEIREPYESEQISFQFNHNQFTHTANYIYPEQDEVELIVGEYTINSYLIRESTWPVTTKKQIIENCIDTREPGLIGFFRTKKHCEKTEIPSIELEHALTGGAKFTYGFTREDLASDLDLTLYILADPMPGDIESMQELQLAIETNSEHSLFKYPEI